MAAKATRKINVVSSSHKINNPAAVGAPARTTSANGIFVYNTSRQGWEISASERASRNLPNVVVINASAEMVDIIDGMLSSSTVSGGIKDYLNILSVTQEIINPYYDPANPGLEPPTYPRVDNAGFTFVIDARAMTSLVAGYYDVSYSSEISRSTASTDWFDRLLVDQEQRVPETGTFEASVQPVADAYAVINTLMPARSPIRWACTAGL